MQAAPLAPAQAPATFTHPKIGADAYAKLRLLTERGANVVQLHVASRAGRNAEVADFVLRSGGDIRYRSDEIDYLRVAWPFTSIASVESLANHDGIQAIAASYSAERPTLPIVGTPDLDPKASAEPPLPLTNPRLPILDMDGEAFLRASPTFDGRGVTIAEIEEAVMPDLLHVHLQHALDLQGRPVPKFAQATSVGDSRADRSDKMWVQMKETVFVQGGEFRWDEKTYLAPRDGTFRFGLLPRPVMPYYNIPARIIGKDDKQTVVIPILWNEQDGEVWVDTNANDSFRDEHALHPYRGPEDIGVFGEDDPATLRRESLGFTLTIDAVNHAIRLNPGWGGHATLTAGVAAGEGFGNGRFDSVAGKARLAIYTPSAVWDSYALVEALQAALRDPGVDVAFYEQNSRQYSAYRFNNGTNALAVALDRVAQRSNKLVFVPGGNGYGSNFVDELSLGENLISVAPYDSRDMLRVFSQIETPSRDNLHMVGAFGPPDDGALKPDLMAPSVQISLEPQFFHLGGPRRFPGHWELPYGVTTGGGSSCAAPTAAAAAAVLISAAKQSQVRFDADRLRTSLFSTARFCEGIQAHQQGRGLIQLGRAWEILKYLNQNSTWEAPRIDTIATVRTKNAERLATPNRGRGLYEREGWKAGDDRVRTMTFIRRNGPLEPVVYTLEWMGDAANFTTESRQLTLPLNTPVELPIRIQTPEARAYSAILRLNPLGEPYEAKAALLTVIAAEHPSPGEPSPLVRQLDIPRPGVLSLFVDVPAGTKSMTVKAAKPSDELLLFFVHPPKVIRAKAAQWFWLRDGEKEVKVPEPEPGVWEIYINNRAMLSDDFSIALMASDAAMRESKVNMGARMELEPRPAPLTPTKVKVDIRLE